MRYVYIALIVVFVGIFTLFKVQNLEVVTVSLFSTTLTMPTSMLVFSIYLLGALTGGFVFALLRDWVKGAKSPAR